MRHRERSCEQKRLDATNLCVFDGQYGDWLRVTSMRGLFTSKELGERAGTKGNENSQQVILGGQRPEREVTGQVLGRQNGGDREEVGIKLGPYTEPEGDRNSKNVGMISSSQWRENCLEKVDLKEAGDQGEVASREGEQQMEKRSTVDAEKIELFVFTEIDQNLVNVGKMMGNETWKRRERQTGKRVSKEVIAGLGVVGDSDQSSSKRRFCLRDEDSPEKENNLSGKKSKIGQMLLINKVQMVEVASHNLLQQDQ